MPNPRTIAKFEMGKDWFSLVDASLLSSNNDDRLFVGLKVAVGF